MSNIQLRTVSLPEEIEDILTEIYIKRLKNKEEKASRSSIIADALRLLWEKENKIDKLAKH